jgi:glycosyltransferase involved in cell wall biosynthesis
MSDSPLNVLVVSPWYPAPGEQASGAFVRDQARAAARRCHVTVLAQAVRNAPHDSVDEGIRILRIVPFELRGVLGNIRRLMVVNAAVRQLRKEGFPPDVIHGHVFFGAFPAVVIGRIQGLPVIVSEHFTGLVKGNLSWRERFIARFTYRYAHLVCPVSELLRERLADFQPRGTYAVIGNAVDVDAFANRQREAEGRSGSRLITVAGLYEKKGIPYLLDALRHLLPRFPDSTLAIVGDGPDRPMLEMVAVGLPVEFLGERSRAELVELMREADIFVTASVLETFGIAPLEALAAGLPVIATSAYPVADLIAELGGLIVPCADAVALSKAIASALTVPHQPRTDAAVQIRRTFGLEVTGHRWEAAYRKVVTDRGRERVDEFGNAGSGERPPSGQTG